MIKLKDLIKEADGHPQILNKNKSTTPPRTIKLPGKRGPFVLEKPKPDKELNNKSNSVFRETKKASANEVLVFAANTADGYKKNVPTL